MLKKLSLNFIFIIKILNIFFLYYLNFYKIKKFVILFLLSSFVFIPTLYLTYDYILYNRMLVNFISVEKFVEPNIQISHIIVWIFISTFILMILNFYFRKRNSSLFSNFFYFLPYIHIIFIFLILILGKYSNINCEQIPENIKCGCYYIGARSFENNQYPISKDSKAYQALFNKKCVKNFFQIK